MHFLRFSLTKITHPLALVAALGASALASAAVDPVIVSPAEGAVVTPPFTVEVTYGDILYCDTDGCQDVPAESVSLFADPSSKVIDLGTCSTMTECPGGKASFEVTLEPGPHELRAMADDGFFSAAMSKIVKITVEPAEQTTEGPTSSGDPDPTGSDTTDTDTTGSDTPDTTSTTGGDAPDDSAGSPGTGSGADTGGGGNKDDGCGCSATNTSTGAFAWLLVMALAFRRRR
jgi:MYXO-CTERM domain-containing protein